MALTLLLGDVESEFAGFGRIKDIVTVGMIDGRLTITVNGVIYQVEDDGILRSVSDRVDESVEGSVANLYASLYGISGKRKDENTDEYKNRISSIMVNLFDDGGAAMMISSNKMSSDNVKCKKE